jgi:hypothetical protein
MHGRIDLGILIAAMSVSACFTPESSSGNTDTDAATGTDTPTSTSAPSTSAPSTTDDPTETTDAPTTDEQTSSTETMTSSDTDSTTPDPLCASVYHDWVASEFAFPDNGAVGITDVPGTPWGHAAGSPTIEGEALVASAESTVVASQGDVIPKEGVRLRFEVSFQHADNEVEVGINGDDAGAVTTSVILRAADGAFVVNDGGVDAAAMSIGPLEIGVPYFVELELDAAGGVARLATSDYAVVPGSTIVAELELGGLGAANVGRFTSATVVPSAGMSPRVEAVSVARCGVQPGEWSDVLVDEFERAALEGPDHPDGSTWTGDASGMSMSGGGVRIDGFTIGVQAAAEAPIGNDHARLRAIVRFQQTTSWPSLYWGVTATHDAGEPRLGFVLWNNEDDGQIIVQSYGAGTELAHVGNPYEEGTAYYVEMSVDGDYAVCSVRTESFAGPVKFAVADDSATAPPRTSGYVGFGNSGGEAYFIDEMRLSQYTP